MKRIFTLIAVCMAMLCSSIVFVSCSSYKNMYLQVEYATLESGSEEWRDLDLEKGLDYIVSDTEPNNVYSEQENAYLMYLRVNIKGTSKKVNSLYISTSTTNAILETNVVKPGEAIKVLIKNVGSVKFNIIPSDGGADKAVEFNVNIYKQLESIEQNVDCLPALVTGGNIKLESLKNLINYYPLGETNQTGVSFKLDGVGTIVNGEFVNNADYFVDEEKMSINKKNGELEEGQHYVWLDMSTEQLSLRVNSGYKLSKLEGNNVIKLTATSNYYANITTTVYVYIVENFTQYSLLVSYDNNISLTGDGLIPSVNTNEVGDEIKLFASDRDSEYRSTKVYTYTSESIYSFISKPGMKLCVYIQNGDDWIEYDYENTFKDELGVKIAKADDASNEVNSLGLKFEAIYACEYRIKLVVDFEAFDFSGSDKSPIEVLTKEIVVKVESLATAVSVNDTTYEDNTSTGAEYVNNIEGGQGGTRAQIYTYYDSSQIGLPLRLQAVPTNSIDSTVYVSFYKSENLTEQNKLKNLSLMYAQGSYFDINTNGQFEVKNTNKIYLKFNDGANVSELSTVYMVCQVKCTPDEFKGVKVDAEYKTIIIKFDVIGAVNNIYVHKDASATEMDTFNDEYLENEKQYVAYINLSSGTVGVKVDSSQIIVTSNGGVKFSKDGNEWVDSISASELNIESKLYKLYFISVQKGEYSIKIESYNGVSKTKSYKFVNVTNDVDSITIKYDDTYINKISEDVLQENIKREFLALQADKSVDFKVTTDGKTSNVKDIVVKNLSSVKYSTDYDSVVDTYDVNAVVSTRLNEYLFNIKANSVGFTSAVYVNVEYYYSDGLNIVEGSKVFIYEIAVYNLAKNLSISSNGKDEILYINSNYLDVASVRLSAKINNNVTNNIYFSSEEVTDKANKYVQEGGSYIYAIRVTLDDNITNWNKIAQNNGESEYFKISGLQQFEGYLYLDNLSKSFNIEALRKLSNLNFDYIQIDFTICQFGEPVSQSVRKILYFGSHVASEGIVVDGVDIYNNIYLNLLNKSQTQILAEVANKDEATYSELDYTLWIVDDNFKNKSYYSGENLKIVYEPNLNTITITAQNQGGKYILELFSKDSYDDSTKENSNKIEIVINVSDGNENNPYLISSLDDFKCIVDNLDKHYVLSNNINISALSNEDWWQKKNLNNTIINRIFKGSLDGAMKIYNPISDTTIYKTYSLIGLTIQNSISDDNGHYFGLFSSNEGVIKNIEFSQVSFDITINSENSANVGVNIGAIAGVNYGTILNCSVSIASSKIVLQNSASNTSYNIGLVVGKNYSNILVDDNGSCLVNCSSAGKLVVEIQKGNTNYANNTNIYIGGIAGANETSGIIEGNYTNNSGKAFNSTLSGVVNIELVVGDNTSDNIMNINNIALGGVVGLNNATIKNIAVTGKIKANDKASIGGLIGVNKSHVEEVANIGMVLEGYALTAYMGENGAGVAYFNSEYAQTNHQTILEQNIGGIIGENNAGFIENVRVLFVTFETGDVNIEASSSYIKGVGNIGGIIGKATDTTLRKAYIENFISDDSENKVYSIIGIDANIAGFIAESAGSSVVLGFVQADVDAGNSEFYEFGKGLTYSFVYFYGDLKVNRVRIEREKKENQQTITEIIYLTKEDITGNNDYKDYKKYIKYNGITSNTYSIINIIFSDEIIEYSKGTDAIIKDVENVVDDLIIVWCQDAEGDFIINNGYPYLKYKNNGDAEFTRTITVQPSDIIVNVDEKYFDEESEIDLTKEVFEIYNNGIYIQYTLGEDVSATAIVYYDVNENNSHLLVSNNETKGLIEKTILPSIANGEYGVRVISGTSIATISGNNIVFRGCGRVELEFYSIYNRGVKDTVVIFVDNKLADETFSININGESTTEIRNYVGSNTLVDVKLISDANINGGDTFDETKLYSTAKVTEIIDNSNSVIENIDDYIILNALTSAVQDGYALGNYEIKSKGLPADVEFIIVTIQFSVYLDLSKYYITSTQTVADLTTNMDCLIATKTLTLKIYNSASDIQIISSGNMAESGDDIDIDIVLYTGYRKASNTEYAIIVGSNIKISNNIMRTAIAGQDNIDIQISASNQPAKDLAEKVNGNIWNLFDTILMYKLYNEKGYIYSLNIELKDEYKYITSTCEFELKIWAESKTTIEDRVTITFVPQHLTTFRMEHYANLVVSLGSNNTDVEAEYVSSESQSSLIIPGYSGLMKIYAEPTYAYCEDITITSSSIVIDGKEYFIRYQQMVYNKEKGVYESLAGVTAENKTLSLLKYSYVKYLSDGTKQYDYDGVLFVRTILENVVGVSKTFTSTISAKTYDMNGNTETITRDKILLSKYKPGVYITVSDAQDIMHDNAKAYLVEQGTTTIKITAKIYGYELNSEPTYSIKWLEDVPGEDTKDYVSIRPIGEVLLGDDNAYYITYSLNVNTGCEWAFGIEFYMELTEDGSTLKSNIETLNFYPTKYILKSVTLEGVANGNLDIGLNLSKNINFKFQTVVTDTKKQQDINETIYTQLGNKLLNIFYIQQFNGVNYENRYFNSFLKTATESTADSFKVIENNDGTYRIEAIAKYSNKVYVDIYYGYEYNDTTKMYELKFSDVKTDNNQLMRYEFNLNLAVITSEDAPKPIYNAIEFAEMVAGENYILMDNITLENWVPFTNAIGSLDGNNKVITIKSFSPTVSATANVGLFASIAEGTIVKNVTINVAQLETVYIKDDNTLNVAVTMGILAGENNGLIYNCEIVSLSNNCEVNIVLGDTYTMTFGGLVGANKGNITNSRVGTEYFEQLILDKNYNTTSNIIRCGEITFISRGVMAGLAGTNDADSIISSSYMANTNITNTSNSGDDNINQTAGFVAKNNGGILYSYSKGKDNSILSTRGRATGTKLYANGSGSVAGFVFENTGDISNCYSNIICESTSAVVAGFVYNHISGSIKQSYSASTVLSGNTNVNLATELPFVGVGIDKSSAQVLLANGEITNCYYLDDGTEYDTNYLLPSADVTLPVALTLEGFAKSDNLNNFTFIESGNLERQLNSIWTYNTSIDKNKAVYSLGVTNLPELTSANSIARSLRYLTNLDEINYNYDYKYATSTYLGSSKNPYIIRDVSEFNKVFSQNGKVGYIRFIDNISFKNEDDTFINVATKSDYLLGDASNNTLTVLDGNGMSISNLSVKYGESINDSVESIGLFSKINYSVIKSLNINYEDERIGSSKATYAGGLAGLIEDTYLMDINLTGNVEVKANNFAGGVAGLIKGDSSLSNITTNLSATAGRIGFGTKYYTGITNGDVSTLSYAGGIAGVIDINANKGDINRLVVNNASVAGDKAGGITGYLSANSNASRLTYIINDATTIDGTLVAGGIIAENYGTVKLSYVSAELDLQKQIDNAFATYINGTNAQLPDSNDYGNLTAVVGEHAVGGLIGINYGGKIENSYTKASVAEGEYIGGITGVNYGGAYEYVYSQSYINLETVDKNQYIGGLFGKMGNIKVIEPTSSIGANVGVKNIVLANIFDKSKIENFVANDSNVLDYTVALKDAGATISLNGTDNSPYMLDYGVFDADNTGLLITNKLADANTYNMEELYNLDSPNQKEIFESLFILWNTTYWELDNTKYMPILKENSVTSFIPIETSADLDKIRANPNGNFMLMQDVEVGKINNSNYVLDIEFTGVLVGAVQSNENATYPSFYGIGIDATDRSSSSGFFRATTGAKINNIGFKYDNILNVKNNLVDVGGVSTLDKDSRFEQVYVFGKIQTENDATINNVGSLVGESERSTLIACSSAVEFNINLNKTNGCIGGLIGYIDGESNAVEGNKYEGLITNSTYKGTLKVKTTNNNYVGGLVGFARYTTISSSNVLLNDSNDVNFDVSNKESDTISSTYIGGIVGEVNACVVNNCKSNINLQYKGDNSENLYIGGQIAIAQNGTNEVDGGEVLLNVVNITGIKTAYIGGVIAKSYQMTVQNVVTQIEYNKDIKVNYVTFGGLIASSSDTLIIDNCMAYMLEVNFQEYKRLIAGGLIGEINAGNYAISNSNSVGQIFAENNDTANTILTIIGGFVGYVGESIVDNVINGNNISVIGNIQNCYTALTMSTAKVYRGNNGDKSHIVYDSAIVGVNNADSIIIEQVIYSSDYTLNFEQDDKFSSNNPQNVTANVLLYGTEFDTPSWWHTVGGLPVPTTLIDYLVDLRLLSKNADKVAYTNAGNALYPILIDEVIDKSIIQSNYTYYNVNNNITCSETIDSFNGVILGNGFNISTAGTLFGTMEDNSALSNANVKVDYRSSTFTSGNCGVVCNTNNGTIFMTWTDYTDINVNGTFGGLTYTNNGRILYSFNTGYSINTSSASGLAYENSSSASIEYSYFTGCLEGNFGYGIVANNYGYISNCYSAGNAYLGIFNYNIDARVSNNYFDYYASFISTDNKDYCDNLAEDGVLGLATTEMQVQQNNISNIFNNWLVYSIENPYTIDGINKMTYNYGYPIHNFNQYTLKEGSVQPISLRAKPTGNGTFVVNEDNIFTNNAYLINNYGTLGLLNTLTNTGNGNLTDGMYFELEYNINLPENQLSADKDRLFNYKWTGIGSDGTEFKGIFTSTSYPNDLSDRGIAYKYDEEYYILKNDEPRSITNFKGSSLFGYVSDNAIIANIEIDNASIKNSTLVNNIKDSVIYNVIISGSIQAIKNEGDSHSVTAGLINEVNSGTVNIYKLTLGGESVKLIDTSKGITSLNGLINVNNATVNIENLSCNGIEFSTDGNGVEGAENINISGVVGTNNGTITINSDDSAILAISTRIAETGTQISSFSGFANTNNGTIDTTGLTIQIDEINPASVIAGAVSTMSGGSILGLKIEFIQTSGSYSCETFGGVVASMTGGSLGQLNNNEGGSDTAEQAVSVSLSSCKANLFGGVIAKVSADANISDNIVTIGYVEIDIKGGEQLSISTTGNGDAFGVVIGKQEAKIGAINYKNKNIIKLLVNNGQNVGGFVGYTTNVEYDFKNIVDDAKVEVLGLKNVGGFIGQYVGEESFTFGEGSNKWFIQENYAEVNLAYELKDGEDISSISAENFGGIIGYWNSTASLTAPLFDEQVQGTGYSIINKNNVLTNSDVDDNFVVQVSVNDLDEQNVKNVIKNIGGVVGYSKASIENALNMAQVGVKNTPTETKSLTSFVEDKNTQIDISKMMPTLNVGGVVGYMHNENGVSGLNISHCANVGQVYGYTCVGGIVGYAPKINTIDASWIKDGISTGITEVGEGAYSSNNGGSSDASTIVVGFADVGGVIGRVEEIAWAENIKTSTSVYGVTNVGGMFGYATGIGWITDCSIVPKMIVGNINVGGIAGNASSATNVDAIVEVQGVQKVTIGYDDIESEIGADTQNKTTIYGSVFEYKIGENTYYFLPTNIGGAFGRVYALAIGGIVTLANVTTDNKYEIENEGVLNTDSYVTVNMVQNRIAERDNVEFAGNEGNYAFEYYSNIQSNNVKYDALDNAGIGGFAGYIDMCSFRIVYHDIEGTQYPNLVYGSTSAFYGINVGGVVGTLGSTSGLLPKTSTNADYQVNVAGKIFVGGYIGRYDGYGHDDQGDVVNHALDYTNFTSESTDENFDLNNFKYAGYVNVQRYEIPSEDTANTEKTYATLTGNCVGGVIGYSKGGVQNIKLKYSGEEEKSADDIHIKIFNTDASSLASSYIGVIAGRVDSNVSNCYIAPELCDAKVLYGANEEIIKEGYVQYGEVWAYHDNDECVGIIQSPDEYNYGGLVGLANVPSQSSDSTFTIQGVHYYAFTVDMVQNQDYYAGVTDYAYTKGENNELATVSAIAHYINQDNIVISVSALNDLYDGCKYNGDTAPNKTQSFGNDCNPTNTNARGWAKEYTMFRMMSRVVPQEGEITGDSVQTIYNANYITEVKCSYDTSVYDVRRNEDIIYTIYQPVNQTAMLYCKYGIAYETDENGVDYGWNDGDSTKEGDPAYYNHNVGKNNGGEINSNTTRANFWKHIDVVDDDGNYKSGQTDGPQLTTGYTYYSDNKYLGRDVSTTFLFKIVYGTISCTVEVDDKTYTYKEDSSLYSNSGSLFEVTGTSINIKVNNTDLGLGTNKGLSIAGIVIGALAIISGIVLACFSGGASLWAGVGIAMAVVGGLATTGSIVSLCGINSKLASMIQDRYTQIESYSMGMAHSIYTREIEYENGVLTPKSDSYLVVTVNAEISSELARGAFVDKLVESGLINESDKDAMEGLIKEAVDGKVLSMPLPMQYVACCNANMAPNNIEDMVEIDISKLPESSSKSTLENLGITKIKVPLYVKVDNELYIYPDANITGRKLVANYTQIKNSSGLSDASLINVNDYAYAYEGYNKTVTYGKSEQDKSDIGKYISEYYKMGLTKTTAISYNIVNYKPSGVEGYDWETLNLSNLYWNLNSNANSKDKLVKTIYYNGINEDSVIKAWFIDSDDDGIDENDFVGFNYQEGAEQHGISWTTTNNGNMSAYLAPYDSNGNWFTSGLNCTEAGYNSTIEYYLEYSSSGKVKVERTFELCVNISDDIKTFEKTADNNYVDYNIYTEANASQTIVIKEAVDSSTTIAITLGDLKDAWDTYKNYLIADCPNTANQTIQNIYRVGNNFRYEEGKLYVIDSTSKYYKDQCGLLYTITTGESILNDEGYYVNYNKYVYNYAYATTSDGQPVKFYTRYNYENDQVTFLNKIVDETLNGETGEINRKYIYDLLLPPYGSNNYSSVDTERVLFAESARITFMCSGDSKIYEEYRVDSGNEPFKKECNTTVGSIKGHANDFANFLSYGSN